MNRRIFGVSFVTVVSFVTMVTSSCGTNGPTAEELVAVPSTPPTLSVDVGSGYIEFEELVDGEDVDLVYGPQGGFHIWTSVRVHDETVQDVEINLIARYEDGTAAGPASRSAASLSSDPEGSRSAAGFRNFIRDAAAARGKRIILRVEVVAPDRRHGAGERLVTAR